VVVINERLAKRHFSNEDPIGQRIFNPQILPGKTERGADVGWEIVGVVGDEKISGLNDEASAVVYPSYEQSPVYFANLVVRTSGDPALLIEPVRRAVRALNKAQAMTNIRSMDLIKTDSLGTERFQTLLLTLLSTIALLLAAIGMYGVISYSVTQRTRELGIRLALGASRPSLLRLVSGNGFTLVLIGLAIGLAGALRMAPLLQSILHDIKPHDPYTMGAVALVLMVISLLARLAPALRASKIDLVISLRAK
jgi:putative ABC transport system permease protein